MSIRWGDPKDNTKFDVTHVGCVISTRERNGYDDSDFYAVVWDEKEQAVKTVEYASTRYWSYNNGASVDITPENLKKANQWAYDLLRTRVWGDYIADLRKPKKGDEVFVHTAYHPRKNPEGYVAVGQRGRLFWIGEARTYGGYSRWSQRTMTKVGIATTDRKDERGRYVDVVWCYMHHIQADERKKFRLSEAKYRMRSLRDSGVHAYTGWCARMSGMAYM